MDKLKLPNILQSLSHDFRYFSTLILTVITNDSSRMQRIQKQLAERALELLALPPNEPCYIADLGTQTNKQTNNKN
jgi:hypothetical protein